MIKEQDLQLRQIKITFIDSKKKNFVSTKVYRALVAQDILNEILKEPMRKLLLLVILFHCASLSAQELNCLVTINDDQVIGSNKQVFRTLEQTISEFINQKMDK